MPLNNASGALYVCYPGIKRAGRRVAGRRAWATGAAILLAAACLAAAAVPASAAQGTKPRTVRVVDFYFGPDAVTVPRGGKVRWVWAASNVESHDVHLKQGPPGLKQRSSYSTRTTAVTNATFTKAFPTPGTYRYICTIHPTLMKMTVTVRGQGK